MELLLVGVLCFILGSFIGHLHESVYGEAAKRSIKYHAIIMRMIPKITSENDLHELKAMILGKDYE